MTAAGRKAEREDEGYNDIAYTIKMEIKYKRIWADIVHEVNKVLGYENALVGIGKAGRENPLNVVTVIVGGQLEYVIAYSENQRPESDGMLKVQIFGDKITPEIVDGIQSRLNGI